MKTIIFRFLAACLTIAAAGLIFGAPGVFAESASARNAPASAQAVSQDSTASPEVTGSWQISWTAKSGDQRQASMQIKQKGSKLSGTFQGERGSVPVRGTLEGNQISLTVKLPRRQLSFTGTVDGDKMSGTTESGVAWTATRQ